MEQRLVEMKLVGASLLLFLLLVESVFCQESCDGDSGRLVGFTALTPEQLRAEIRAVIQENLSGFLDGLEEKEAEEELVCQAASSQVESTLGAVNDSLGELRRGIVQDLEASLQGLLSRSLREAVANITAAFREELASLGTTPRPPTSPSTTPTSAPPTAPGAPVTTPRAPPGNPSSPTFPPVPPGFSPSLPAQSCLHIQQALFGRAPSGRYWVVNPSNNVATMVYCNMTLTCGDMTGGWMRVADLDMTDTAQQCPGNFSELTKGVPPTRLCTPDSNQAGCFSHTFLVAAQYQHVCGRIVAYQESTPNAFFPFQIQSSLTIDDVYVDGISLTRGNPRSHVWTFAAALDESLGHLSGCACSNTLTDPTVNVPPFVGQDYFCDTGSRNDVEFLFYADDPLWDGRGCGPNSICCSFNNPPWFFRELASATSDDLEMRVCRDSGPNNEDTPFEAVELYVR